MNVTCFSSIQSWHWIINIIIYCWFTCLHNSCFQNSSWDRNRRLVALGHMCQSVAFTQLLLLRYSAALWLVAIILLNQNAGLWLVGDNFWMVVIGATVMMCSIVATIAVGVVVKMQVSKIIWYLFLILYTKKL